MSCRPHSSGAVRAQQQGNYCTYCMQRGDSSGVFYLFDCQGMRKEGDALRGRTSKPVEISRGKVISLLLLIRTVLK